MRSASIEGVLYVCIRDLVMDAGQQSRRAAGRTWALLEQEHEPELTGLTRTYKFPGRGQRVQGRDQRGGRAEGAGVACFL